MLKKIRETLRLKRIRSQKAKETAQNNDPTRFDRAVFAWKAPLRHKQEKGRIWMVAMSVIVALLLFYGAATRNWIFLAAIITAIVAYAIDHYEATPEIEIKISEFGVKVGSQGVPFSNIKAFWILYQPPFSSSLHMRTYSKLMPDITIELNGEDPAKIREFLTRHIVEWEGKQESLMDTYIRLLKL